MMIDKSQKTKVSIMRYADVCPDCGQKITVSLYDYHAECGCKYDEGILDMSDAAHENEPNRE